MKVEIGPYERKITIHNLVKILLGRRNDDFSDFLYEGFNYHKPQTLEDCINYDPDYTWFSQVFEKIATFFFGVTKKKIKIKIHEYDTWNLNVTLGYIILPLLKQLYETKHGSAIVDLKDCPVELFPTIESLEKENYWIDDDNLHKRWDYVLNEMIWAFETVIDENFDDTIEENRKRQANGLRLFGKYYQNLWD